MQYSGVVQAPADMRFFDLSQIGFSSLVATVAKHPLQIELIVPSRYIYAEKGSGKIWPFLTSFVSYPFGSSYIDTTLISLEPYTNRTKAVLTPIEERRTELQDRKE